MDNIKITQVQQFIFQIMQINLDEAKNILLYIINNNKRLQDSGQFPVSVSLCGGAGVGK